ncbi:MAG: class I SAM-dependent methyltransferase, partial [Sphingobacteriales bacterium]
MYRLLTIDELLRPDHHYLTEEDECFYFMEYVPKKRDEVNSTIMNFKKDYPGWNDRQVQEFYESLDSISRNRKTDLTDKSLEMIIDALQGDFKNVLDVGCAKGYVLSEIRKVHPQLNLTGVDFVAENIEQGINFVKADIRKLPFEDKTFDVVLCSHTIEHMPD